MPDYINIKIPKDLGNEIDKMIQKRGYASRAEFVKEAVRKHIDEFKKISGGGHAPSKS